MNTKLCSTYTIICAFLSNMGVEAKSIAERTGWEELNCELGHKYLFSDLKLGWYESKQECELYGGHLVQLDSTLEQNCLLRYARSIERLDFFWTDANDIDEEGFYVHATNDQDIEFQPRWEPSLGGNDEDGIMFSTLLSEYAGTWVDARLTDQGYFICEGLIL